MHRFRILSAHSDATPIDFMAHDAATVFHFVERMACSEADVERDGTYAFSLRLDQNGLWSIHQRGRGRAIAPQSETPA